MASGPAGRVLAIDPGTIKAGYAVLTDGEPTQALAHGTIAMPARRPMPERLNTLHIAVTALVQAHTPRVMAAEAPYVGKSPRSALAIGQAQAIVLLVAAQHQLPVHLYSPAQVKYAVANNGRASKDDVIRMVSMILGLEASPRSDEADALAVALCHLGAERERRHTQN